MNSGPWDVHRPRSTSAGRTHISITAADAVLSPGGQAESARGIHLLSFGTLSGHGTETGHGHRNRLPQINVRKDPATQTAKAWALIIG